MPSFIVKPKPDEDFYVMWSTVVDAPTGFGSRGAFLDRGEPEERLARADEYGSSAHRYDSDGDPFGWFHWDDDEAFAVMNGPGSPGTLARGQLRAYCEAGDDEPARAAAMVTPLPDDES